ncbi:group I truncated hemoglobin [Ruegeria arenilitoris]|uniref:group I truncated hemoglobin n=1 Tax=Ruegeria arenilitoris TaxID=1173585 RepID=UPI001481C1E5|nr:group 1 truncated hemoglobin [Ruegeria arenilitoris]
MTEQASLYSRLGGYDAIATFADTLMPKMMADEVLGRFWANRGADGIAREHQLLVDYLVAKTGGALHYTGRDMKITHVGMKISEDDWNRFLGHAVDSMNALSIPTDMQGEIAEFVASLKDDIVEV